MATSDWESRHLPVYGHGLCYTFANTTNAAGYAGMQFYVCSNGLYVRKEWAYKNWSAWVNLL